MSTYSRSPLEPVVQNKEYYTSQSSSKVITSTIRQCTSVQSNLGVSQMKRSMSGTSIYSSQLNVPPPARQQLGKSMDIVCFLMACEIERFVAENDKLKYRIKEMDDKLLDRNSYEKQIEDLQARLMQLQYQESMYRQEIEITTSQYTQEIESWKIKYFNNEEKFRSENEQLKQQLLTGDQKKQKEIDDLRAQLFSVKNNNENELQKLREQLQNKIQAVEYYQMELNQYETQFKQYQQQEDQIVKLENQIGMLVCETERLNGLLKQKLEELENTKSRYQSSNLDCERWRSDYRTLQSQMEKKSKDYDQLNSTYVMTQNELLKYKDQDQIIDQMQNKISLLQGEIDRLNQVLREKIKQGEDWRQKYFDSDNQCKEMKQKLGKMDQLQLQLRDQVEMFQQLTNSLEDQKMKNYQLQQQNTMLDQSNGDFINRIELLTQEIERLNNILRLKVHEMEEFKQKSMHYEQEFKNKSNQFNDCKNKLTSLTQEIDRLQEQLRQKQLEFQNAIQNQNQTQKELNNQEQINISLSKQIEEWKRKYTNIEYDLQESQMKNKKLIEYENTIAMLSQEIERLKSVSQSKLNEFDDLKRQMMSEIQKLKQTLGVKSTEAEEWMSKYRRLESAYAELSQSYRGVEEKWKQSLIRIILHCSEVDRLTQVQAEVFDENEQLTQQINHYQNQIKTKDDQLYKALDRNSLLQKLCDEEKAKRLGLENSLAGMRMYQENCQILEQKIMTLSNEIQRVNEQLRIRNGEIEDYRTQISRYENKIQISNQELERVNQQLRKAFSESDEIRKEKEKWEQQYSILQRQYEELRQKFSSVEIYKTKYIELENRCAMLSTEIERLNQLLLQKQEEIEALKKKCYIQEQQIIQLKQYEENIRVLSNEIDRLQGIIDLNEAELKQWRLQYADGGAQTRKIQDLMFHFVMQSAEIESLRARVQEKEKEVEEVRRSSLAPYRR